MEEKKLTDEEIVKVLDNCINEYTDMNRHSCDTCPYKEIEPCGKAQMIDCLDLIHRLQDENGYLKSVADTFQADYKKAKADGVMELLQELIEMEIKLDPLRSGIRYKALIGYAEENGIEVDL